MTTFKELEGSRWSGEAELWLDPLGHETIRCDCTMRIEDSALRYTWSYKDAPQQGSIQLREGGADFTDTWHQPTPMSCADVPGAWGLFCVTSTYSGGEGPDWGWRTFLSLRTMGEPRLVLQMTNIAPWGEEGRAVRMICARDPD